MAQLNIALDQDEIIRLLADSSGDAFLAEEDERRSSMGKMYYSPACKELERRVPALVKIAREQCRLCRAA